MGFGTGGGGSSSVSTSADVALNNPINNDVLTYDSTASKWKNGAHTSAIVVKWNGSTWGTYSTNASDVRLFMSQNDVTATAPTYYSTFDLWYAHPSAP